MTNRFLRATTLAVVACALLAGCASYYRVTEPGSGRQYYTTNVDKERDGSVTFKDSKTKSEVTLQSSEVVEVPKKEYEAGIKP
jgi:uncharacterized protein YceK